MWVLLGPFDGEIVGDSGFQKSKLLKPSTSYTVGRKDRPLLVNNKKISHDHCNFVVGPHSTEDVGNPSVRPLLELVNLNKKDKNLNISRDGEDVEAYPFKNEPLQDGDEVSLLMGLTIVVKWIPICAYASAPRLFSVDACASLGIKLVHTPQNEVTHHITTELTVTLCTSASLLSLCQFVKPEWLKEVIRLGSLPRQKEQGTPSLEDNFVLPLESKHRPTFSRSLLPSQKKLSIWEPNEERVNLFHECRFICLSEKVTASNTELQDVIHLGGGTLENFEIHQGVQKFRRALSRSQTKEGKRTVVVGDIEAMESAVGKEEWEEFVGDASSCSLTIHPPPKVIQAVLDANTEPLFEFKHRKETSVPPAPEIKSNEVSQEPDSQASQGSSRPRLVRRATSRAASREPSVAPSQIEPDPLEEPVVRPRRLLTRRAVTAKHIITGIDDPSSVIDSMPDLSTVRKTPPPELIDLTASTPGRPTKLKRRFGLTKESQMPLSGIEETVREPPLKKFKALFEASNLDGGMDVDTLDSGSLQPSTQTQTETDTQAQSSSRHIKSMGLSSLAIMHEEEEESQATSIQRGLKRRLPSEEDVEMLIVEDDAAPSVSDVPEPANKRRAMENVNAVEPVTTGTVANVLAQETNQAPTTVIHSKDKAAAGATPGKPDSDPAFLKAIASTKRGKKSEDEFDREFNKLKISKPEIDRKDPEEDWKVLADFGDDSGLRGNFMVILEMETFRKDGTGKEKQINLDWSGKPNFKKFKKKVTGAQRPKVDLFISDDNDYGMSNTYWKSGNSQGHSQAKSQHRVPENPSQEEQVERKSDTAPQKAIPSRHVLVSEDDEEPPPAKRSRSLKPSSRAGSVAPPPATRKASSSKAKAAPKKNALFLDSDDDIQEVQEVDEPHSNGRQEEETLKSSPEEKKPSTRRKTATTTKSGSRAKKPPVVVADDSDDDAVFKGFKGKRGGR